MLLASYRFSSSSRQIVEEEIPFAQLVLRAGQMNQADPSKQQQQPPT